MIAICNVVLEPVRGKRETDATVLVEAGKIKQICTAKEADLGNYEQVIDGMGMILTPGFIDTHTHLGIDEEGIGWEGADFNETTEALTPHLRAIDGINPFDRGFFDAAEGGVTTAQVLPGSANVIGGITAIVKVKPGFILEDIIVRERAGLKMAFGENPKKYHGQQGRTPSTRMGIAGMIREQLVLAAEYLKNPSPRDLRKESLGEVLERRIPVCVHAHRADDIMTAIRIAEEFDLDLHLEHVTEGHRIVPALVKYKDRCKFSIGPTLSGRSKVELSGMSWDTYRALDEQGISFSIITDHPVVPVKQLKTSVKLAVEAGLDADTALESVTIRAAEVLGLQDQTGSIEVGKDADLVLWDKHPVKDGGTAVLTMAGGEITYQTRQPL
ncbi:UNVERIFIED_CONTAM: amidohydrolase [Halobacillus marinus]|uniref:amidohydrolase n=1 Tax=Halobacillus sp. BAB-2008 TaxID=1246484 RepID=UPI0002A521B4|nr:amidohydrolase [Halobacillus sp. BAB-2008]ELK47794.1 amidohydrolase [Halobacillus sp. BAB-2008]